MTPNITPKILYNAKHIFEDIVYFYFKIFFFIQSDSIFVWSACHIFINNIFDVVKQIFLRDGFVVGNSSTYMMFNIVYQVIVNLNDFVLC